MKINFCQKSNFSLQNPDPRSMTVPMTVQIRISFIYSYAAALLYIFQHFNVKLQIWHLVGGWVHRGKTGLYSWAVRAWSGWFRVGWSTRGCSGWLVGRQGVRLVWFIKKRENVKCSVPNSKWEPDHVEQGPKWIHSYYNWEPTRSTKTTNGWKDASILGTSGKGSGNQVVAHKGQVIGF